MYTIKITVEVMESAQVSEKIRLVKFSLEHIACLCLQRSLVSLVTDPLPNTSLLCPHTQAVEAKNMMEAGKCPMQPDLLYANAILAQNYGQ